MEFARRYTKKYCFKSPNLLNLRELGSLVMAQEDFRHCHGFLLSVLQTNVEEGILDTLVQFYDPLYHCFTFPDYQLVPTLEEYSYWIGLPILHKIPFTGSEDDPKPAVIASSLHLETPEVKANLVTKGGLRGLTSEFLFQKAHIYAKAGSTHAFHAILALLIYGLVLFPNIDDFVDVNAIQIFLSKNPVPTLLANTYLSIHDRTLKGRGTIFCCTPLLYKWFISHLPQSHPFTTNPENLLWSQRIMSLTPTDIVWYNPAYDNGTIIDSCGEFPNVPLIGIHGGITYNPTLARRQFGYPMKTKPNNLSLAGVFYLNHEDSLGMKARFVRAWRAIHKKIRSQLGRKSNAVHETYTQWVLERAAKYGMPYPIPRNLSIVTPSPPLLLPCETKEQFQELLAEVQRERDTWKERYYAAENEIETLKGKVEQREHQLFTQSQQLVERSDIIQRQEAMLRRDSGRKRKQMEFFSQSIDPDDPDVN